MFGYVRCANDELKVKELRRYQAYYCGVCRAMGKFTKIGRCVLSYDLAFYALLMDYTAQCSIKVKRCAANGKKKPYAVGEAIDYAGYMNILLSVGKLKDDINDQNSYKKILLGFVKRANKKAERAADKAAAICHEYLNKLNGLEAENCACVDRCADVFAQMCAELCVWAPFVRDGNEKRLLYSLGYSVARWVYIIDALDDYCKDVEKGCFNPIAAEVACGKIDKDQILEVISNSLYNTLYDALKTAQLLPESSNKPIIMNIVQYGLADVTKRVTSEFEVKMTKLGEK